MYPEAQVAGSPALQLPETTSAQAQYLAKDGAPPVSPVSAQSGDWTLSAFFGIFNIVVGLMIVAAFVLFFGGFSAWLSRLGLESRLDGIKAMYYGTTILFVLIVLLAVVKFVQTHTELVLALLGVVVVALVAWAAVQINRAPAEEDH
jgi:hypothetical protein